jgi:ElaB/YqjD/DUF883 family membrane-anchored ribosome-binding protein
MQIMETREKENINFWKQKAEEIRVQLNLGAAEAADKYEEEKKAVRNWIHETEQKMKENGDSRLDKLRTKLEELKVQASLGRADARDEFEEQRKKFNTKLHEARQEAKELSDKADSKSKEIGEKANQRLQAWQTQFDIFNVQLHLGAREASEKWNEQKGKLKSWLDNLDDQLDEFQADSKDSWENFRADLSNSWSNIKAKFSKN